MESCVAVVVGEIEAGHSGGRDKATASEGVGIANMRDLSKVFCSCHMSVMHRDINVTDLQWDRYLAIQVTKLANA